jgi:hypothetical protein
LDPSKGVMPYLGSASSQSMEGFWNRVASAVPVVGGVFAGQFEEVATKILERLHGKATLGPIDDLHRDALSGGFLQHMFAVAFDLQ